MESLRRRELAQSLLNAPQIVPGSEIPRFHIHELNQAREA